MDRRQRKTRNAIYTAFLQLLSQKDFGSISVQEIIDLADVGRATFYAHFETKDYLLKSICEELFSHIVAAALGDRNEGYKDCKESGDIFLHLLIHLKKNDNNVLALLTSPNNELFLRYFKEAFKETVKTRINLAKAEGIPEDFATDFIASTFVETVLWWAKHGVKESPERIAEYLEWCWENKI